MHNLKDVSTSAACVEYLFKTYQKDLVNINNGQHNFRNQKAQLKQKKNHNNNKK